MLFTSLRCAHSCSQIALPLFLVEVVSLCTLCSTRGMSCLRPSSVIIRNSLHAFRRNQVCFDLTAISLPLLHICASYRLKAGTFFLCMHIFALACLLFLPPFFSRPLLTSISFLMLRRVQTRVSSTSCSKRHSASRLALLGRCCHNSLRYDHHMIPSTNTNGYI